MVGVVLVSSYALINREMVYEMIGVHPADYAKSQNDDQELVETNTIEHQETTIVNGSAASIRKGKDGQQHG